MKISLPSGKEAWLIGDPHLGRKFEVGVPLHRRGERERRQIEKFKAELATPEVAANIMVGDLFDHPHVGFSTVMAAADAVLEAAKALPNTQFFMMAGNHDRSRQMSTVGAWEMFERLLERRLPNVTVVTRESWDTDLKILMLPWRWDRPVSEQLPVEGSTIFDGFAAIGHWDLQDYGGDTSHLAPTKALAELGVTHFYSGHFHIEGRFEVDGLAVNCTGSLEPYSHGEDPTGEIYVTMTLPELKAIAPELIKDKCVRVLLAEGEELPENVDCLALTKKRLAAEESDDWAVKSLGEFDWAKILEDHLKDVDPDVRNFINERMTA